VSFKGTGKWAETNYLSNITPQKSDLNRGSWMILENRVRGLVGKGRVVFVMTGHLFERKTLSMPGVDESHKVPSGYWKIISIQPDKTDSIKAAGFIFDQATSKMDKVIDRLCTIDEIETRAGLDFLRELPDEIEEKIESSKYQDWVKENF